MANRVRRAAAGRPAEHFTFEDWPVKRRKIATDGMILLIFPEGYTSKYTEGS